MNDFWMFYTAAALSAAFFAVFQIYIPALNILEFKSKTDYKTKEKLKGFLDWKLTGGMIFVGIATVIAPLLIPAILSESVRKDFVNSFVEGVIG